MKIEILGTESLGVRGMSCFVSTKNHKILIDPGISLGYIRHKLLPHPLQIAVDEKIQKSIINKWKEATDIVISHFHGDHVPLKDANPYQLNIKKVIGLNKNVRLWIKNPEYFSSVEKKRAKDISFIFKDLISVEGKKQKEISFSKAVPHGEIYSKETVMMTKIQDDKIFVHASDIQLLNKESISQILLWKPDIVFAAGPPLYLELPRNQIKKAWHNAIKLARNVDVLILDHHLMRSCEGLKWLKILSKIGNVICGADFMNKPKMLLEAKRKKLYEDMPIPTGWHEDYAKRKARPSTIYFLNLAKKHYKSVRFYK